jgi:hypothetical protein
VKISKLTRTRRGRVALAAVPAAAAVTLLMAGVANGAVPVSFAVSGQAFQVGATELQGTGFSQYSGVAVDAKGNQNPVAISNIENAKLTDLCQFVGVNGTPLGLKITAGGGGKPATATGLQIGMSDLKGDATFKNIRIGIDASKVATTSKGTAGDFAQDASSVDIKNLQQTAYSTTAGTFTLNGLHLFITGAKNTCF